MCQKLYENWVSVDKVIAKIIRLTFLAHPVGPGMSHSHPLCLFSEAASRLSFSGVPSHNRRSNDFSVGGTKTSEKQSRKSNYYKLSPITMLLCMLCFFRSHQGYCMCKGPCTWKVTECLERIHHNTEYQKMVKGKTMTISVILRCVLWR